MSKLVIIRGLPGSGKSTLAKQLCKSMSSDSITIWYEADMYFEKDGRYEFNRSMLGAAHAWCLSRTDYALECNYTAVVSNTFTTKKELIPYFELAHKYRIAPQVILCQGQWENVHNVPKETLEAMKNRFEYDIESLYKDFCS